MRRAIPSVRNARPPANDTPSSERRALRVPRDEGPLEISPDVRTALVRMLVIDRRLAAAAGEDAKVDPAPAISLEAIDALEDHFRARMPDDALAIFAAGAGVLDGFELRRVGALTDAAWERGLSKARIVLGELGPRLVCIPRRPDRGYALRVTFFDPEDGTEGDSQTLAAWLDRILEEAIEHSQPAPEGDGTLESIEDLAEDPFLAAEREVAETRWEPRVERTMARTSQVHERVRRVRHARFGEGVVVREIPESDKLEIDFGGRTGVKVLVSTYVEELERTR